MKSNREPALKLIKGTYDLHTHTIPSHFPRALDDFALVREADEYGMAGVMIKSHYETTGARAALVNRNSKAKAKAFGSMALNWPLGGLNPYAVTAGIKMGVKLMWMPTRDSMHCLTFGDMEGDFFKRPGITIFDDDGNIKVSVYEILEIARETGIYIGSGHLSPKESIAFCKAGREMRAPVILTHPDWDRTKIPLEAQLELAKLGVIVEKVWANVVSGHVSAAAYADSIRRIGAGLVYVTTDRGQQGETHPAPAMVDCIEELLNQGVTEKEIHEVLIDVPKAILSI